MTRDKQIRYSSPIVEEAAKSITDQERAIFDLNFRAYLSDYAPTEHDQTRAGTSYLQKGVRSKPLVYAWS